MADFGTDSIGTDYHYRFDLYFSICKLACLHSKRRWKLLFHFEKSTDRSVRKR